MKKSYPVFLFLFLCAFCITATSHAQTTPPQDTTKPLAPQYNAGFDVIIKKNGDILYGLVQEVGLQLIKYKRTDIPDGPVYTIPRYEVYAISYRNQVKEIITDDEAPGAPVDTQHPYSPYDYRAARASFFRDGSLRFGLGFIRNYTHVKNASNYSSSPTFPVVNIAYDVLYRDPIRVGVQLAFGSHKFKGQEYSNYDSTQSNIAIKENIFTLHLYGKYGFLQQTAAFQPYVLAGLGLTTSNVHTDYDISFINNPDKVVQVRSGARSVGLGVLARIGTDYYFNTQLRVFGDVGVGPALLNIGIALHID